MSYNVDNVKIMKGSEFRMNAGTYARLQDELDGPEITFLDHDGHKRDGADLVLENLWWQGEGSGRSWEEFEREVVPNLKGKGRLLVVWEGGDSTEIYTIADGQIVSQEEVE